MSAFTSDIRRHVAMVHAAVEKYTFRVAGEQQEESKGDYVLFSDVVAAIKDVFESKVVTVLRSLKFHEATVFAAIFVQKEKGFVLNVERTISKTKEFYRGLHFQEPSGLEIERHLLTFNSWSLIKLQNRGERDNHLILIDMDADEIDVKSGFKNQSWNILSHINYLLHKPMFSFKVKSAAKAELRPSLKEACRYTSKPYFTASIK